MGAAVGRDVGSAGAGVGSGDGCGIGRGRERVVAGDRLDAVSVGRVDTEVVGPSGSQTRDALDVGRVVEAGLECGPSAVGGRPAVLHLTGPRDVERPGDRGLRRVDVVHPDVADRRTCGSGRGHERRHEDGNDDRQRGNQDPERAPAATWWRSGILRNARTGGVMRLAKPEVRWRRRPPAADASRQVPASFLTTSRWGATTELALEPDHDRDVDRQPATAHAWQTARYVPPKIGVTAAPGHRLQPGGVPVCLTEVPGGTAPGVRLMCVDHHCGRPAQSTPRRDPALASDLAPWLPAGCAAGRSGHRHEDGRGVSRRHGHRSVGSWCQGW